MLAWVCGPSFGYSRCFWRQDERRLERPPKRGPSCTGELIEIDHYGERLIGCVECNRWNWRGSKRLFMELPEEDIEALKNVLWKRTGSV